MEERITQAAVLGLGRFGMSVVRTLANYDIDVLACDHDPARIHEAADFVTHAVLVELHDESAVRQLGLNNFDVVIIAIGEDFESEIIATSIAKELGVKQIFVKASGLRQKSILEMIGADHVVLPEIEMGERLAMRLADPVHHTVLENSEYYQIKEIKPLDEWIGKTIAQSNIRRRYDTNILAVRNGSEMHIPVAADYTIKHGDRLITMNAREAE